MWEISKSASSPVDSSTENAMNVDTPPPVCFD